MEDKDLGSRKSVKLPISVIVLTYNEEKNLEECLEGVHGWARDIFVVDSFSTDKTMAIAGRYTGNIYQHPFVNQAKQLNWALDNLPIETEWVFRLDADERPTPELKKELEAVLGAMDKDTSGIYIKRRVFFMGRWIRHGGYYPTWILRIWRRGKAYSEERWMDEHVIMREGRAYFLKNDFIDDNRKDLHWWVGKHNDYAKREAVEMLGLMRGKTVEQGIPARLSGPQDQRKRWLKEKVYARLPLFVRPFLYFIYRYFLRLGVLDGREGLIWHFMQGFWYRFLVDAKIFEVKRRAASDKKDVADVRFGRAHV